MANKPADFPDVLEKVAAGKEARTKDRRKFIAAAKPLVTTFSEVPAFIDMTDYSGQPSGAIRLFADEDG